MIASHPGHARASSSDTNGRSAKARNSAKETGTSSGRP